MKKHNISTSRFCGIEKPRNDDPDLLPRMLGYWIFTFPWGLNDELLLNVMLWVVLFDYLWDILKGSCGE